MKAFFDDNGDLWLPVGGTRPDGVPSDMVRFLTSIEPERIGGGGNSGAADQPAVYLNLTRYALLLATGAGCG